MPPRKGKGATSKTITKEAAQSSLKKEIIPRNNQEKQTAPQNSPKKNTAQSTSSKETAQDNQKKLLENKPEAITYKSIPPKEIQNKNLRLKESKKCINSFQLKKTQKCILCQKVSSHLFRFPKDPKIRKEWIDFCKLPVVDVRDSSKICNSHFRAEDFIGVEGDRVRLRKTAVPSVQSKEAADGSLDAAECSKVINENVKPAGASVPGQSNILILNPNSDQTPLKPNQNCILLVKKDVPSIQWAASGGNAKSIATLTPSTAAVSNEKTIIVNAKGSGTSNTVQPVLTALSPLQWNLALKSTTPQDVMIVNNTLMNMAKYKPIQPANFIQQIQGSDDVKALYCTLCGKTKSRFLFKFPKNQLERIKWAQFCNIKLNTIKDTHALCEKHFKKEDFCIQLRTSAAPSISYANRLHSYDPVFQFATNFTTFEQNKNTRNLSTQTSVPQKGTQTGRSKLIQSKDQSQKSPIENIVIQDTAAFSSTEELRKTLDDAEEKENSDLKKVRTNCYLCPNTDSMFRFKFPKDSSIREKWLKFCNIPQCELKNMYRLCGDHFREEDFTKVHKTESGQFSKKLHPSAVPTILCKSDAKTNANTITPKETDSKEMTDDDDDDSFDKLIEEISLDDEDEEEEDISDVDLSTDKESDDELPVDKVPKDHFDTEKDLNDEEQLFSTAANISRKRTIRYLGDVSDSDPDYPASVKRFINIAKDTAQKKTKRIKVLLAKIRRMSKKMENYELIISHLVELQNTE